MTQTTKEAPNCGVVYIHKPEVSVIIPAYNRRRFLMEAALSVLNQTFKDFELIIYDDASSDGSGEMVKSLIKHYPKNRIKYIFSTENKGPSFARNRGVERSCSRYIAFLDSDDLWIKNKLKIQYAFMVSEGAAVCQTDEIWIRNEIRVNPMKKHEKGSGDIFEKCLELCVVSPSAVMMERRIFEESGGFDESLPACEDYDLWLRIALKYPVHLIPKKLVIKRGGHADQLSRTVPHLDRFRIYSMEKLLRNSAEISAAKREQLLKVFSQKCGIYAAGLKKRQKLKEAEHYEKLPAKYKI